MPKVSTYLVLAILLSAGGVTADQLQQHQDWAGTISQQFAHSLGLTMQEAMKNGGPSAAISVCRDQAPAMAGRLSREHGAKITHVGMYGRNPLLGMPDAYEQGVLRQFSQRAARDVALRGMHHAEVVEEPNGRYFRYPLAIVVEERCLVYYGGAEQRPAIMQAVLKESYRLDAALDYRAGELRGAMSIKQPTSSRF